MKKQIKTIQKLTLITLFTTVLCTTSAMAQDEPPGFEDDVDDEPALPINDYIYLGLLIGAGVGMQFLKKKQHLIKI